MGLLLVYMHEFMDIDFPTLLIFLWWLKLFPLTWLDFQKYCVHRTLCFSVYLLSQCMLGPFIHMTQRKYVTIIWWPIHVLSMLYRSWCRKITISEIFTGVLCTVGGTLVEQMLIIYNVHDVYHTNKIIGRCLSDKAHSRSLHKGQGHSK
jgi:hypothetical protein